LTAPGQLPASRSSIPATSQPSPANRKTSDFHVRSYRA
jgi:hypothetical protein